MSFTHSPKIVQEGLVFYVDAANPRSYVSGSTTTDSLSGNISGSLENDIIFSPDNQGTWAFDGVGDRISFSSERSTPSFTSSLDPQLNSFTCNIFFKISPSFPSSTAGVITSKGNRGSGQIGWMVYYSTVVDSLVVRCNGNDTTSQRASQTYPILLADLIGSSYMISLVIDRDNDVILGYLNGSNNNWNDGGQGPTSNDISGFGSIISPSQYLIGTRDDGALPWVGDINLIQIYNRALTQEEILQNYNALKGRYN